MYNWIGQDIEVGDHVYKGARSGNTSDYRVGEVLELRERPGIDKAIDIDEQPLPAREAKVKWLFRHGGAWKRYQWEDKVSHWMWGAVKAYEQNPGWNGIDSLVKVDISGMKVVPDGQYL